MTLQPIGPRLLVKPDEPLETLGKAGIIVAPDKAKKRVARGVIVAVGDLLEEPVQEFVRTFHPHVLEPVDASDEDDWVIGDTCRLASGGPVMTVTGSSSEGVVCTWYDRYSIPLKVGDRVVYGEYTGTDIREGEEDYLLLTLKDVYALESTSESEGKE